MKPIIRLLLATGLLIGCATTPPNESSPWFRVPVGSELVLNTQLQVPAWQNQVYFQDGIAMDWRRVNIYRPHCALAVANKSEEPQPVSPDRFQVKSFYSQRFFKQVRRDEQTPTVLPAAFGTQTTTLAGWDRENGTDYEVTAMVMDLESPGQPQVERMICADWGLPQDAMYISVEKVRKALGNLWRLDLRPAE